MTLPPTADLSFRRVVRSADRAYRLVDLHRELTSGKRGKPPGHLSEILRAAFLLGMSTLDAFVRDYVVESVGKEMRLGVIHPQAFELIEARREYRERVIRAPEPNCERLAVIQEWVERQSAYDPGQVSRLMKLCGVEDFWASVSVLDATADVRMPSDWPVDPSGHLAQLADRRNLIVHRSDMPINSARTKTITRAWTERQLDFTQVIAMSVVLVFTSREH